MRSRCRPRPARRRWPRWPPIRSAPTRGSAPTPISSTCSGYGRHRRAGPLAHGRPRRRHHLHRAARTAMRPWRAWRARFHAAAATDIGATGPAPAAGRRRCGRGARRHDSSRGRGERTCRAWRSTTNCARAGGVVPAGGGYRALLRSSTRCPAVRRSGRGWCAWRRAAGRPIATEVWALPAEGFGALRRRHPGAARRSARCCSPTARGPRASCARPRPSATPGTSPRIGGWRAFMAAKG